MTAGENSHCATARKRTGLLVFTALFPGRDTVTSATLPRCLMCPTAGLSLWEHVNVRQAGSQVFLACVPSGYGETSGGIGKAVKRLLYPCHDMSRKSDHKNPLYQIFLAFLIPDKHVSSKNNAWSILKIWISISIVSQ